MSERNPGWSDWPEEPDDPRATVFGTPPPVRQPRYPEPPPTQQAPGAYRQEPTLPQQPQQPGPTHDPYAAGPYAPEAYTAPPVSDRRRPPDRAYGPGPGPRRPGRQWPELDERGERDERGGRPSRGPSRGLPFGAGVVFGVGGLVCFLLALLVLPWFQAGGQDVTLSDIRRAFTIAATDPGDLPGAPDETSSTLPEGIPSPDDVEAVVEDQVRATAAEAAAAAIDSGRSRYLELYTDVLWIAVAVGVALAVVFSTILTPRSWALSLLLGFRRLSGLVIVLAGVVHGVALWVVFTGDGAPEPAFGVWLGVGGLAAVLVGCVLGPKRST